MRDKNTFLTALLSVFVCVCAFSACKSENNSSAASAAAALNSSAQTQGALGVANANNVVVGSGIDSSASDDTEEAPFTSYSFEMSHYDDKYMVTVELNDDKSAFVLTAEDKNFGFTTLEVKAPQNYNINIPYSSLYSDTVCSVIKNTVDNTPVPDIIGFTFYSAVADNDKLPYSVSKYYTICNNEIKEIKIDNSGKTLDYCPQASLYHTEPCVFMAEPTVYTDDNGALHAKIYTYSFDAEKCTFEFNEESTSSDNPLYCIYAAKAVADNIYSYFSTTSLNVKSYDDYITETLPDQETASYFFKVDDKRFGTVEELKSYVNNYFSNQLTDKMFISAPQKYRDIDGALYTIVGDGGCDETLGKVTVNGYTVENGTISCHTKQEHFSDEGKFIGFIDHGDFVFTASDDGTFKVTKYYN